MGFRHIEGGWVAVHNDRPYRSICLCFDAASGLNTVRHMRVHATYWAARFPTSLSYHTVVDDALQISHCFDSLFLFSLGQVRLVALSVFAIGENLPRGNLQLSVSLLQGAAAVSVSRRGPVIVPSGGCGHGGRGGKCLGGIELGGESELGYRAPSSARVLYSYKAENEQLVVAYSSAACTWIRSRSTVVFIVVTENREISRS
jgi:hypothetical protein